MGDARSIASEPQKDSNVVAVDAYALVQAILGRTVEKARSDSDRTETLDYDCLPDIRSDMMISAFDERGPKPDNQPQNVRIGCCNPYALVEAMLGRRIDRNSVNASTLISQVLQTDYDELFDMKNKSVLFAGLQLNEKERIASQLTEKDIRLLSERDLMTPDLSRVQRLQDLEQIGLKDLNQLHVKHARIQNGKIRLVIQANANGNRVARQVSNRELTRTMNEFLTPFRMRGKDDENMPGRDDNEWSPPNASWRDMYDYFFQSVNRRLVNDVTNFSIGDGRRRPMHFFDDPTQGASTNSWLIAAIFSVFWASPASINRATRVHPHNERMEDGDENRRSQRHTLRVRFHDKGGNNNNRTENIEVNYEIPITNSNNEPVFARASDGTDIWPSLYEKAFAKWILGSSNKNEHHPDITSTHSGDPIKAMAQINGRDPQYFRCENHNSNELLGVVRQNCVNNKVSHHLLLLYLPSFLTKFHDADSCPLSPYLDHQPHVRLDPRHRPHVPGQQPRGQPRLLHLRVRRRRRPAVHRAAQPLRRHRAGRAHQLPRPAHPHGPGALAARRAARPGRPLCPRDPLLQGVLPVHGLREVTPRCMVNKRAQTLEEWPSRGALCMCVVVTQSHARTDLIVTPLLSHYLFTFRYWHLPIGHIIASFQIKSFCDVTQKEVSLCAACRRQTKLYLMYVVNKLYASLQTSGGLEELCCNKSSLQLGNTTSIKVTC